MIVLPDCMHGHQLVTTKLKIQNSCNVVTGRKKKPISVTQTHLQCYLLNRITNSSNITKNKRIAGNIYVICIIGMHYLITRADLLVENTTYTMEIKYLLEMPCRWVIVIKTQFKPQIIEWGMSLSSKEYTCCNLSKNMLWNTSKKNMAL